ncbi:MAG: ORF6N domain-containing protein [Deltaproteobacteria bacterium]|nr:ORF6N domain-containing protein [Deltaproteobacteria bacterium]MBW2310262.1 ORF6N domain-containing protein [Deltaproteobacteria bacterium]
MTEHPQQDVMKKDVTSRIITIRGQKVILDADLAVLYGVETKTLNKAVSRNRARFPEDFAFRLTRDEFSGLRFQNGTSNQGRGGRRYPPYAFTEHGAIMAASVLHSRKAEEMSVFVVRAFVKMREQPIATRELARRLAEIEKELVLHDAALLDLYEKIRPLFRPPKESQRNKIGFSVEEKRAPYRAAKKRGRAGKR